MIKAGSSEVYYELPVIVFEPGPGSLYNQIVVVSTAANEAGDTFTIITVLTKENAVECLASSRRTTLAQKSEKTLDPGRGIEGWAKGLWLL